MGVILKQGQTDRTRAFLPTFFIVFALLCFRINRFVLLARKKDNYEQIIRDEFFLYAPRSTLICSCVRTWVSDRLETRYRDDDEIDAV